MISKNTEEEAAFKKARNIVFRLLKIRRQSEKEVRDKLGKKSFDKNVVEKTIEYFKGLDLIDDRLFAQEWIRYRLAKPYGQTRIRFELKNKGVAEAIIDAEINEATAEGQYSELETVSELAQNKINKYRG